MNTPIRRGLTRIVTVLIAGSFALIVGCAGDTAFSPPNPRAVEAFTSGEISRWSDVKIVFTEPIGHEAGTVAPEELVRFIPGIRGEAVWADPWTLEFKPSEPLRAGQQYDARFAPASLGDGTHGLEPFTFAFRAVPQEIDVEPEGLAIVDPGNPAIMEFRATVRFSDVVEHAEARDAFSVTHEGAAVDFVVDGGQTASSFTLRVPNIARQPGASELVVAWDAGREERARGRLVSRVPARDSFEVLSVRPVVDQEQYVEVSFSQPLDERQNLAGLISSDRVDDVQIAVRSNRARLYAGASWPEASTLMIASSVRSMLGQVLAESVSRSVAFPTEKPRVRFIGDGVIIPTSQGTTVPIETMNLNAIMVEAVQVYGTNVHQFLQVNRLDGGNELYRVGEVVWRKVIDLGWDDENTDRWTRYGLDISPLLEQDPTGLYQLRVTFRRPHIQYPCGSIEDSESEQGSVSFDDWEDGPANEADSSYWDSWGTGYPQWQYRQYRTDPCHAAYYMAWSDHNVAISRNVMVSDIGVLATAGQDGTLTVAVNNFRTTEPMPDVALSLFNFQRRELASLTTDSDGMADVSLGNDAPFFLLAEHEGQYGYLRLDQGSARVTSHFDTSGASVVGGIQGFIYGERGVWRPGDDIYLTFILHDPDDNLPDDHP
ncbi:MAG TPA: hypothetical protein VKA06_05360, partial [Spirochaetia bacterium]|nr:hypothetical protein [Spirochaetia bacterium]